MSLLQYTRMILLTFFLTIGLSSQAAVVHIVDNGQLIGATGVEVGGSLYNVTFTSGTFTSLYPNGVPVYHDTEAEAFLFAQALLASVFIDLGDVSTAYDTRPELTRGCPFPYPECLVLIPFAMSSPHLYDSTPVGNYPGVTPDSVQELLTSSPYDDYSRNRYVTFAIFSPSNTLAPVPEPSSYAMLAAGLLILAGFSRRSNRV